MTAVRHLPLVLVLACAAAPLAVAAEAEVDIPFTKFVLDNGLTLIVHEDHKAPIVAVNVWYHVGSKNEKPGKTGFAHLFEHLMFNGSEHYNDDYFKPLQGVGATDMNGTTNFDRTNYFQNVPTTALDVALWMESDRMGHLLGAIDQARLDEQRGVVQNEKRQGENEPYGKAFRVIVENTAPAGHPYSWSVIGSLEDLAAASLDDVREWFRAYYGAANAVLTIAGDVEVEDVRRRVEHYFGDIPPGPPVERHRDWIPRYTEERRKVMADRVAQPRIYQAWTIPEWGSDDALLLELLNDVLVSGKNSRLFERLVYKDRLATDVGGFVMDREIGGLFVVWVTAQPGGDLPPIERILRDELSRLLADGLTLVEVDRVRSRFRADFLRGIERVGGFGGKSDILAQHEVYGGDPARYQRTLRRAAAAQPESLLSAGKRWLTSGAFVLEVHPFPEYTTTVSTVDRSAVPEPTDWPRTGFPAHERTRLTNGLELILVRRPGLPLVELSLLLDAGFAADHGALPGTAALALDMLDEGTTSRKTLQISQELALAGAELTTGSDLDTSFVALSALRDKLAPALDVLADVVLHPSFSGEEFERLKTEQLARIARERTTPRLMPLRALPKLLYGAEHPYGLPLTGSGTEESISRLSVAHLRTFHETWFHPAAATLVAVGDLTIEELRDAIDRRFGAWRGADRPPRKKVGEPGQGAPGLYLIDRPDSIQSVIIAGRLAPPKQTADDPALEAMNEVLGGSFTSRINMNLREDKHWSYGARSRILDARGPRPFFVQAPVQTDKTADAIIEIRKELTGIVGDRGPTAEEVERAKDRQTLSLPGRWETARAVRDALGEVVRFDLPGDHWSKYPERIRALTTGEVARAAGKVVDPGSFVWIVVGDAAKVEGPLRGLGLGELRRIDADGAALD
jgi:zinc protease